MKTTQEKLNWELQAYGMSEEAIKRMLKEQAFPGTEMMFAAGMLSDAQHILDPEFNDEGWVSPKVANQARQYMNIAKYIMFKMLETKTLKAEA